MFTNRLVGLVRISLVAASMALAGSAAIGATPAAAGDPEPKTRVVLAPQPVGLPTHPLLATRCDTLGRLASGASKAGDPKQAHDFQQEAADLGCL